MTIVADDDKPSFLQTQSLFIAQNSIPEEGNTPIGYKTDAYHKSLYLEQMRPNTKSLLSPKTEKTLLSVFLVCLISFICVFSMGAITMEVFVDLGTVSVQIIKFNVTESLEIALNNLTNSSISYQVHCPDNYIYSDSAIICSPACNHWDYLFDDVALFFETAIILFLDITGLLLGLFTLSTWPFVKSFWKFPQVTILFLVICLTLLTVVFTIVDIPGFYCNFDYTQSFHDVFTKHQANLMGAGAVIHYLRIAIMFWTIFTLLNVFLSTLNPSMFNPSNRMKNVILLVEFIIAFGVPSIYISVTLGLQIKLFWNFFGYLPDYANTAVYMLGRIVPDYFSAVFSLIFVSLILTRLRFISIDSKSVLGSGRKLTPLEIRLVIYSFISSIVFYFFLIEVCLYLALYTEDISNLYNHRACLTLKSPITETHGNHTTYRNATYELIPVARWNGGLECEGTKTYIDAYPPIWLSIYNICYRLTINTFFLISILKINIMIWVGWAKWLLNCLLCVKNSK